MLSKEKFTMQFNVICDRVSFWESMAAHLAMFEGLVHRREYLTHEDRKTLRRIHDVLYESYEHATKQRKYHSHQLERLRKEYINER